MKAARFEDLEVWRRAKDLAVSIYQVTNAGAFIAALRATTGVQ
ncbi:MAG TPA: hypothetical protein VFJ82_08680 [Longimicrobium sp.]|nr:hypothetical protein [Longimicrobium sp.]